MVGTTFRKLGGSKSTKSAVKARPAKSAVKARAMKAPAKSAMEAMKPAAVETAVKPRTMKSSAETGVKPRAVVVEAITETTVKSRAVEAAVPKGTVSEATVSEAAGKSLCGCQFRRGRHAQCCDQRDECKSAVHDASPLLKDDRRGRPEHSGKRAPPTNMVARGVQRAVR